MVTLFSTVYANCEFLSITSSSPGSLSVGLHKSLKLKKFGFLAGQITFCSGINGFEMVIYLSLSCDRKVLGVFDNPKGDRFDADHVLTIYDNCLKIHDPGDSSVKVL